MNRRNFIQALSGAVAAIATASLPKSANESPIKFNEAPDVGYKLPDGFEVVTFTQPMDDDYVAFTLRKWRDGEIVAQRKISMTNAANFTERHEEQMRSLIRDAIDALKTV